MRAANDWVVPRWRSARTRGLYQLLKEEQVAAVFGAKRCVRVTDMLMILF